jgi:hypothetical protein
MQQIVINAATQFSYIIKRNNILKKIKIFGSLFLAMLSCFSIGLYTSSTLKYNESVETHRWIITSLFGIMFLVYFLIEFKKK